MSDDKAGGQGEPAKEAVRRPEAEGHTGEGGDEDEERAAAGAGEQQAQREQRWEWQLRAESGRADRGQVAGGVEGDGDGPEADVVRVLFPDAFVACGGWQIRVVCGPDCGDDGGAGFLSGAQG